MAPPLSSLTTNVRSGWDSSRGVSRPLLPCRNAMSPMSRSTFRPVAAATPAALEMSPSMPFTPRLASTCGPSKSATRSTSRMLREAAANTSASVTRAARKTSDAVCSPVGRPVHASSVSVSRRCAAVSAACHCASQSGSKESLVRSRCRTCPIAEMGSTASAVANGSAPEPAAAKQTWTGACWQRRRRCRPRPNLPTVRTLVASAARASETKEWCRMLTCALRGPAVGSISTGTPSCAAAARELSTADWS